MKLTINLPAEEIDFLDRYARSRGIESRSAAIRVAIRELRAQGLVDDYASAWMDADEQDGRVWDQSSSDGLSWNRNSTH